ncbi:Succinate dehydrogenase/fumarate reductase, flavoprotein subunit [Hoeflea phototrophica DFL-43]|jgi:fumarate reductase flavoprotein subunit|uniref:Succinate dehydrogenase/fumarate reductase, flavoprotein subunit n=1 Tax=Hoeflea phototrophica (strain DSM 17068 / NCIMB 14078 / DFL-43) TaxID=411684 RepID=A9D953_HOEPD|nr:FAD-dependent oxidoreductase [Hoeflea phototrophica]EDQ32855.1 Succinate dehydrogenase/fumarate reductase, flavoprotein subunit [Hoeflea phototrophica DFL-43]
MSDVGSLPAFDFEVQTLIVGAGAAGLTAALAAHEAGQQVLVIEADAVPSGSTALSAGLIPAAGTRFQQAAGIDDTPALFAADIQRKAKLENDPALVAAMAQNAAPVVEWLSESHGLPFSLVTDFDYPGHARRRMHGLPSRSGRELIDRLRQAAENAGIDIVCNRRATAVHAQANRVTGLTVQAPDGVETIACQRLILACNGFGGNREMVARYMPKIENAVWFGHDGNRGEAVEWAEALGLETRSLGAFQGHGNVAHPHGILITWAVIMEGGIQVNTNGQRFWNEAQGYSEAARAVLAQPGGVAWAVFDARIAAIARQFEDFKQAEASGAVRMAEDVAALAEATGLPQANLCATLSEIPQGQTDRYGRRFGETRLTPPYAAVKVTGALFHTQGGIAVDPPTARARLSAGGLMENLHATGGAACGVSGTGDSGYLSGNGLLSAVTLGWIAGSRSG